MIQNQLLQRSEELVGEIDFEDDVLLQADQVFQVVKQMCGFPGNDSNDASPGSLRAQSKKKEVMLKKAFGSKALAAIRPQGNPNRRDVSHGASLPSLKRNVAFENQTFFIKNRNIRLGVHGHTKSINKGD